NEKIQKINSQLEEHRINQTEQPRLSVKVNNIKQAKICLDLKVDDIYLSGDVFLNDKPFTKEEINELMKIKGDTKIYLGMPHMTFDSQFDEYAHILAKGLQVDGLLATNIGGVWAFKDYNLIGDYPLNILNKKAASLYGELGLKHYTISPEANLSETISLLNTTGEKAELIVHGSPTVMYMEHDLYDNVDQKNDSILYLKDEAGFNHPIYKDCHGRNHMLLYKNICCLPILKGLHEAGLSHFRLEIAHLNEEEFIKIVTVYKKALKDFNACETLYEELKQEGSGFTLAALGL
uniref:U32 family peptidase n=1 Tax=Anaerosporobacter sp. TaxID=1872529 RepID=UPI000EF11340